MGVRDVRPPITTPRGPSGLWAALCAAETAEVDTYPVDDHGDAHLAYLARLAVDVTGVDVTAVEMPMVDVPAVEVPAVAVPAVAVPAVAVPAVEVTAVQEPDGPLAEVIDLDAYRRLDVA